MKKLFTLLTLLVFLGGGKSWGDPVTVGRTIAGTSATSYTVTTVANTTVAISDGSVNYATDNKELKHLGNSETYDMSVEYKNQLSDTKTNVTEFNEEHYVGFSLAIADGYKFTPTKLNLSLATSANFSYKAEIRDGSGNIYYVSDDIAIVKYDKNVAKGNENADKEFILSNIVLTGTIYVRLYTWVSSNGKYYVPKALTLTGEIATATTSNITVGKTGNGSVSGGGTGLTDGTFTTLTATDGTDVFQKWTKASDSDWESTTNPLKILINGDESYTAVFGAAKSATTTTFSTPTTSVDVTATVTNTATVTGGPGGETIIYSSSNPDVAKVNATTGEVQGMKPGTATITATYAGNEDYAESSDSYDITVSNASLTAVSNKFWKFSDAIWADYTSISSGSLVIDNLEAVGGSTFSIREVSGGNTIEGMTFTKELNIGSGSTTQKHLHFKVAANKRITIFGRSNSSSGSRSAEIHVGTFDSDDKEEGSFTTNATAAKVTYLYTGGSETDVYVYSNNTINIFGIRVDDNLSTVSVPVGTTGWSTYSSSYALDFGNADAGIEAYAVTGFEGTTLTTSKITGTVAANTGLLVKGTASTSYNVPVVAEGDAATGNKLVASVSGETVSAGTGDNVNYVLMNNGGTAEFQWIGTTSANVGANKAYLSLANGPKTGAGSRGLIIDIDIDGVSTGINMVNGEGLKVNGSETYYDLQGRRVLYPTKGLYIVNGKKVVIK